MNVASLELFTYNLTLFPDLECLLEFTVYLSRADELATSTALCASDPALILRIRSMNVHYKSKSQLFIRDSQVCTGQ